MYRLILLSAWGLILVAAGEWQPRDQREAVVGEPSFVEIEEELELLENLFEDLEVLEEMIFLETETQVVSIPKKVYQAVPLAVVVPEVETVVEPSYEPEPARIPNYETVVTQTVEPVYAEPDLGKPRGRRSRAS